MLRPSPPPYALPTPAFRFPALARLAGRLPLGAGREGALAALLAARLADGALAEPVLPLAARAARATAAIHWFSVACPDTRVRAACVAVAEASATTRRDALARAVTRVIETSAAYLDGDARAELAALVRQSTQSTERD